MRSLNKKQREELREMLRQAVGMRKLTEEDMKFLMSSAREWVTYQDIKAERTLTLPDGSVITPLGTYLRRVNKVPRGPGKKPKKVLVQVRMELVQHEALKELEGTVSEHVRQAVDLYLAEIETKGEKNDD